MGGYGSGRPRTGNALQVVEECLPLDISLLATKGLLGTNGAEGVVNWSGKEQMSLAFRLEIIPSGEKILHLDFFPGMCGKLVHETIRTTYTQPNFGGVRWWFICPGCGSRRSKLYLPLGQEFFLCRACYRLAFYSQQLSPYDRVLKNMRKIRCSLGGSNNLQEPFPTRPDGMPWRTYMRLWDKYRKLELKYKSLLEAWLP